jgi:ethanolamine ammonia-lyase small subunit
MDGSEISQPAWLHLPEAPDAWSDLRQFTSARIAIGRSGGSQRTSSLLDFRLSHARARDAVMTEFDAAALDASLKNAGLETMHLASAARDRRDYLLRPDHGRTLAESSRELLSTHVGAAPPDLVPIVSDGLSAVAAMRHAAAVLIPLHALLKAGGWRISPVVIVPFARVKLQDEIGAALGARFTLMLLGERPGLGAPDSLGAYFTHSPGPDKSDADRNCVSNIRKEGLEPALAARKIEWLLKESARSGLSGVELKDSEPAARLPAP